LKVKTLALSLPLLIVLMVCLQTPIAGAIPPPTPPPPAELLWMNPIGTNDIALSKDGQYVAAVGLHFLGELAFYSRSSGTPIWTYLVADNFWSVAISADGDCVAAGNGSCVFFWKYARSRTLGNTDPTWTSVDLGGSIEDRCLAMSDDGNYVVACGTGRFVFYWANAKSSDPSPVSPTWKSPDLGTADAVDLSSDGDYVATGGDAYVAYWKNARTLTGNPQAPDWKSTKPTDHIGDVAISDDGNYVAAAGQGFPSPVYYWANAKNLSDDPTTTWESAAGVDFSSIDMSSDGDSVIAGAIGTSPGVYFWDGARGKSGTPNPSWTFPTTYEVEDVAIDDAGDYMAAADPFVTTSYMYFFDNKGNSLWNPPYQLDGPVSSISISSDGGTLAVGTGGIDSDYLFNTGYPMKPVGGVAVPTGKLALISPWIGIAFAAIAVMVFAAKRRRKA